MPTPTATNIIIATTKYLNTALKQINKNPLMPPSDTITCKSLFQLDSIFYNASYALKSKQPPILKLPPKPIALPPRVFPSTTQDFHNIYLTTQKHRRDIRDEKPKNSPKKSPLLSP